MIVCYTRLYSHREKADFSSEITNETIGLFFGAHFRSYLGAKKRKLFASSTKWKLGENVVLLLMKCLLQRLVIIYLWMVISYLFVYLPTVELTSFEQQLCSTKVGYAMGTNSCKTKGTWSLWTARIKQKVVYILQNHRPPKSNHQPTLRLPTHPSTTDLQRDFPLTHRSPSHWLQWPPTLWLTKLVSTESPLDQSFHKLISIHSDGMLFLTAN